MSEFSYTKSNLQVVEMFRARATPGELIGVYDLEDQAKFAAKGTLGAERDDVVDAVWVLRLPTGQGWLLKDKEPLVLNTNILQAKQDARERALAKLDADDIAALGL